MNLDSIDRKILEILQEDGRASHSAIAEEVGLTQPSVHERVKKLEQGGVITGYTAILNPAALGLDVLAFVSVRFNAKCEAVAAPIAQLPQVLEAHHIAGDDCLLVKVRSTSPKDLEGVLDRIWDSGAIASTKTTIVFSSFKETSALSLNGSLAQGQ